jgi:hypothetical protein
VVIMAPDASRRGVEHNRHEAKRHKLQAICRSLVPLAVGILFAGAAVAEPITVGAVDKTRAQVEATQAGQTRALVSNRKSILEIDATADKTRAFWRR